MRSTRRKSMHSGRRRRGSATRSSGTVIHAPFSFSLVLFACAPRASLVSRGGSESRPRRGREAVGRGTTQRVTLVDPAACFEDKPASETENRERHCILGALPGIPERCGGGRAESVRSRPKTRGSVGPLTASTANTWFESRVYSDQRDGWTASIIVAAI